MNKLKGQNGGRSRSVPHPNVEDRSEKEQELSKNVTLPETLRTKADREQPQGQKRWRADSIWSHHRRLCLHLGGRFGRREEATAVKFRERSEKKF